MRFVQRVTRAFQLAGERGGEVRLRLAPPELGRMILDLSLREGTLSARLEVETQTARNVLLENLPALRERLSQQDIKVSDIEVGISDLPQRGQSHSDQEQDSTPQQSERRRLDRAAESAARGPSSPPIRRAGGARGGLDVVI